MSSKLVEREQTAFSLFEETKRTEGKHANTADAAKYLKLSDKEIGVEGTL